MGSIISEGLDHIGHINDKGQVFNQSGEHIATIDGSGNIIKVGGRSILGKIDEDGTIRDSMYDVVGRIQADGYVYIHSQRVCHVSSKFVKRITPKAWNAGQASSYHGRDPKPDYVPDDGGSSSFFFSPFFIKVVIGLIIGIIGAVNGMWDVGAGLIGGPFIVLMFSFFAKIFG